HARSSSVFPPDSPALFLFTVTATTGFYTLSLHDALPIFQPVVGQLHLFQRTPSWVMPDPDRPVRDFERRLFRLVPATQKLLRSRSEEHTSELQSPYDLVCRLLLEKKKQASQNCDEQKQHI